jgi:hypothetical protein
MSKSFNIHVEGIEKEFSRSHSSAISEKTLTITKNQFSCTQPCETPLRLAAE